MDKSALEFFKELSNVPGPSGFENEAIRLVCDNVSELVDSTYNDGIGNFMFEKRGEADSPRILLTGHVDEIGFIITGINPMGFLTFNQLGGWFDQTLLGQRVILLTKNGKVPGIIACKPVHLMDGEERKKVVTIEKMFIDVGASNVKEVEEMGIRMGDAVVPDSKYSIMTKTAYKDGKKKGTRTLAFGKAFDDRYGVFVTVEAIRQIVKKGIKHPNTVIGAATVQEEVGARGAKTVANSVRPDVAIVLDVEIAGDVPGLDPVQAPARMGSGVTISVYDASMIPNQPLKELVIAICKEKKIDHQLTFISRGGSDGGMIHTSNIGIPTIVIGVAVRHIHSHVGVIDLGDVDSSVDLVVELIQALDRRTVLGLTKI
jgi:putative aminopeptidase FrvX